ncbi:protein NOI4-like isoform X2 [Magnolia sinica]|uniref:protein NOI4-like isoform X2 n=1 Tax=Magnolia sinica TaxID=86752 RepID=UPI002659A595|nr:protein NOI4-like isoform X2 [Magnolia sinica]
MFSVCSFHISGRSLLLDCRMVSGSWSSRARLRVLPSPSQSQPSTLRRVKDKGRPLPKFGEWDVNDPASAEGFTVIFNKARDERKTGGNTRGPESPGKDDTSFKQGGYTQKPNTKKWFCCIQPSSAES